MAAKHEEKAGQPLGTTDNGPAQSWRRRLECGIPRKIRGEDGNGRGKAYRKHLSSSTYRKHNENYEVWHYSEPYNTWICRQNGGLKGYGGGEEPAKSSSCGSVSIFLTPPVLPGIKSMGAAWIWQPSGPTAWCIVSKAFYSAPLCGMETGPN